MSRLALPLLACLLASACGSRALHTTTRTYRAPMLLADAAVLAMGAAAIAGVEPDSGDLDATVAAVAALSTVTGPLIHAAEGNRSGAAYSAVRRIAIPATVIAVLRAGVSCGDDHGECSSERAMATQLGWLLSAPVAIAWDVFRAKVDVPLDVTPSVSASTEHAVIGLGGRF